MLLTDLKDQKSEEIEKELIKIFMRYVKLMRRYSKSKRRESVKTLRALN
jgi:hypothetical protein